MKAVLLAAILVAVGAPSVCASNCEPAPKERRENDKKYRARIVSGDRAFREGKYVKAYAEYRASLAYQDLGEAGDAYFRMGEAAAMLANFENAYTCIIESGSGKLPAKRVSAPDIANKQAREAAQILLDTIQINTPRYPYGTYPEYLALAAIFRQSGLVMQAQGAEEEGRINRQAADAWEAALVQNDGHASLAAADRAAMEVYERAHRPETAEILRAQATLEPPLPRRKRSFWYLLVTANL